LWRRKGKKKATCQPESWTSWAVQLIRGQSAEFGPRNAKAFVAWVRQGGAASDVIPPGLRWIVMSHSIHQDIPRAYVNHATSSASSAVFFMRGAQVSLGLVA
jgi:hypothetical protein